MDLIGRKLMALDIQLHIRKNMGEFQLNIDFESCESRIGILGASGCGKSLTLKCIAGIIKPDQGKIIINGKTFFDSEKKINMPSKERNVGYLFQNYALFPTMTVEKNIASGIFQKPKKIQQEIVAEMIKRFDLTGLEKRYPHELSGGQQQRVAFARMMAYQPDIILLDEPFSALDGFLKEKLQHELMEMLQDYSKTVLLVSHSRDEIYRFGNQILTIEKGQLLKSGNKKEIFLHPEYVEVARLTGCNNIVPVLKDSDYEIYVPDWNIHLKTLQKVSDDITHIGLRSHDIRPGKTGEENTFLMVLSAEEESPFENKYYIQPENSHSVKSIWWKQYKDLQPETTKQTFPCYLTLPKENLLLLKNFNHSTY